MTAWPADNPERRKVADLVPYARNSRTHTAEQISAVAASIKEWGWTTPVLVADDGMIIAGHCRVLAANKLRIEEIPVLVARGWSEAQKRAYVIADNQLAISADWDKQLLKIEIEDLEGLDFDIELLGFEPAELGEILNDGVPIAGDEEGSSASGADAGDFLKWAKQRIPLAADELESLERLVSRYVEIFGLAHGFARWIVEGKHLQ